MIDRQPAHQSICLAQLQWSHEFAVLYTSHEATMVDALGSQIDAPTTSACRVRTSQ